MAKVLLSPPMNCGTFTYLTVQDVEFASTKISPPCCGERSSQSAAMRGSPLRNSPTDSEKSVLPAANVRLPLEFTNTDDQFCPWYGKLNGRPISCDVSSPATIGILSVVSTLRT